ncbi:Hypothetical protein CINCED_3A001989 [Cinara cedri]|uniref:Uncharacterized protein n=1 Tax=Cinara cedri TaxID=506608 RepID=A0A5E4N378_9HEMI|nr:Hypothetical protein CINCED_3A001989 [Cinara cedri]
MYSYAVRGRRRRTRSAGHGRCGRVGPSTVAVAAAAHTEPHVLLVRNKIPVSMPTPAEIVETEILFLFAFKKTKMPLKEKMNSGSVTDDQKQTIMKNALQ